MRSFTASTVLVALAALPSALAAPFGSIQPPARLGSPFPVPSVPGVGKFLNCDVTALRPDLPAGQTTLVADSTLKTRYIGLGVGVQNYTCGAAGTYTSIGAVAQLYDVSCLAKTPLFAQLPKIASSVSQRASANSKIAAQLGGGPFKLGDHIFRTNPTSGALQPVFDFTASQGASTFVVAAKKANLTNPAGAQNVDLLQLAKVDGTMGTQVFRLDTNLGQPPASCTPGSSADVSIPYAANYWFLQ